MTIWALAGCSASVSTPGSTTTGGIRRYPTAEPLTGPAPVGYWACVSDFDPAELRMSNSRVEPSLYRCRDGSGSRPSSTGPTASAGTWPDTRGGADETTRNQAFAIEVVSENVIRVYPNSVSSFLMFRIGSPEYIRMATFRDCVNGKPGPEAVRGGGLRKPVRGTGVGRTVTRSLARPAARAGGALVRHSAGVSARRVSVNAAACSCEPVHLKATHGRPACAALLPARLVAELGDGAASWWRA